MTIPFLFGFALGSIPFAWIVVRYFSRRDVSNEGSHNVGALNASRVSKSKWVFLGVFLVDFLKGAAAVWLAAWWAGSWDFEVLAAAAAGAVAGHNYNPWLSLAQGKLVGGKGFAALAGASLVFRPWMVVAWLVTCALSMLFFRKARGIADEAPASALATLSMIPWGYALYGVPSAWYGLAVSVLVVPKIIPELITIFGSKDATA